MKRIIITLLALLTLSFYSCNILTEDPKDFVSPQNFFKTEDEVTSALYGVYEKLHNIYIVNPAKRKATPIKNEKRFSEQKRKAMKIIKAIPEIVSPLLFSLMMGYTFKSNFTFSSPANNCCVFPILFS